MISLSSYAGEQHPAYEPRQDLCRHLNLLSPKEREEFEQVFNITPESLLKKHYPSNLLSVLFELYAEKALKFDLANIDSCDLLLEYPNTKEFYYVAAVIDNKHISVNVTLTSIAALDASLLAHALSTNNQTLFSSLLEQLNMESTSYLKNVFFILFYEAPSNSQIKNALTQHHQWLAAVKYTLISEVVDITTSDYLYQVILQRYFKENDLAIESFKLALTLDNSVKYKKEQWNVVKWLIWHDTHIEKSYFYQYLQAKVMHEDKDNEFIATPKIAQDMIDYIISEQGLDK